MAGDTKIMPPVYYRARQRIIEEVAIQQVADSIVNSDEGIPLPEDWSRDIDGLRNEILGWIRIDSMTPKGGKGWDKV